MVHFTGGRLGSQAYEFFSRSCSGRIVAYTEVIDSLTQSARDQIVSASEFSPALEVPKELRLTGQMEFSFWERYFRA
jgi:hypothetical protein